MWVSPFRYLRILRYLLLPAAFRSLSRLSSAPSAKASALRPFLLNPFPPLHSVAAEVLFSAFLLLLLLFLFLFPSFFMTASDVSPICYSAFAFRLYSISLIFGIRFSRYVYDCLTVMENNEMPFRISLPFIALKLSPQKRIWQPPALPCRPQHSTIGRLRLN